jgi:hypothetical protein
LVSNPDQADRGRTGLARHQAGGPETESNGFAPCSLHHKTFDLGAFTVSDGILLVSDQANGTTGFHGMLTPSSTSQEID